MYNIYLCTAQPGQRLGKWKINILKSAWNDIACALIKWNIYAERVVATK